MTNFINFLLGPGLNIFYFVLASAALYGFLSAIVNGRAIFIQKSLRLSGLNKNAPLESGAAEQTVSNNVPDDIIIIDVESGNFRDDYEKFVIYQNDIRARAREVVMIDSQKVRSGGENILQSSFRQILKPLIEEPAYSIDAYYIGELTPSISGGQIVTHANRSLRPDITRTKPVSMTQFGDAEYA